MPHYQQLHTALNALTPIPDEEFANLREIFQPQEIPAKTQLVRAGEKPKNIVFVLSGMLRLYYVTEEGLDYTRAFCLQNELAASYSALLMERESRLFMEAMEDSNILTADFKAYQALLDSHVCWQILNRKIAEYLFVKKEQKESELLLWDDTKRYINFLEEYPGLADKLKLYHIASYLGISPVSLSRIRKAMV